MGVGESQETMFVYVVTSPAEDDWRRVVGRYGHLLGALPRWVFRACFPPDLKAGMTPLPHPLSQTSSRSRSHPARSATCGGTSSSSEGRWPGEVRARKNASYAVRFSWPVSPRFRALHQRWLVDGEAAFEVASSHAIVDHLGRFRRARSIASCCRSHIVMSLPWLAPTVFGAKRVEEGVGQGAMNGEEAPHVLDPRPTTATLDAADTARATGSPSPTPLLR